MLSTDMTMSQALCQVGENRQEQEALVCGDERITYGQMLEGIEALAKGLYALGIGKGDKVAALLHPGPEFVYLFFALARLGSVIIPLNPSSRSQTLSYVLKDAEPVALVSDQNVDEIPSQARSIRYVILVGQVQGRGITWQELLASKTGTAPLEQVEIAPADLLALLYTSGTTGQPKGTMHTHRSLIAPVVASIRLRELWLRRPGLAMLSKTMVALKRYRMRLVRAAGRPQVMLSTAGWHTITGLEVMLQALLMGDTLVIMSRFHPRQALQLIEKEKATILVAVPAALQMMLAVEGFAAYDKTSLLICGTGAAPCSPDLARQVQAAFGCAIHIGFGATETAGGIAATSLADSDEHQTTTVGRPMPGMEVKIVDEHRREMGAGEVGELACRSGSLMAGYYRSPELTAEVIDEEGWYYTGDLAWMDEGGYLHIAGRKKDVIIRGGQNIYPAEIENYLATHPKIQEVAVVGIPSTVGGETAVAFVLLQDGSQMTAQEVLDYCRKDLESYKIPSHVVFVSEFPRSESGKPQKFKLMDLFSGNMKEDHPE